MLVGLGLVVGAVLQPAGAQVRDTLRRDSTRREPPALLSDSARARLDSARARAKADSVTRDSLIRADTIKAGIAVAELPLVADPTGSLHWTRKDMFATGALTVLDLLEHVPGVTGLQSRFIAHPMFAAYLGDMRRLRVYVDGFELEVLDPRQGRVWDLSQIPLFSLDDLLVERTASEVRIHMRTWRVDKTIPFTRTDIYTGDQATNLYRGLYGRRYRHGEVLQLSAQQYSTTQRRGDESSDQLAFMSRVGIARRMWTADVVINRQGGSRGRAINLTGSDSVVGTDYTRYDAYARFAWQDTAHGWWAQGLAGSSSLTYSPPNASTLPDSIHADTARSRAQYVFTGGFTRGPWQASFTQRYRVGINWRIGTPAVRASWDTRRITIAAEAEGRAQDSTRRFDLSAVARPLSFLFVGGAVSKEAPLLDSTGAPMFVRGELGVHIKDVWLTGGVMWRDRVELDPPSIVLRKTPLVYDSTATGFFATLRGRVWRAIYVDAHALRWNDTSGVYRPQYQVRSELYLSTSLLNKIPSGNFHMRAGLVHEYRSTMFWPDTAGVLRVPGYRVISTHLQFKILTADVFWTYRNNFGERYPQIPGYRMPRPNNIYGVRWEFWN